jgi:hypothetical protein
MREITKTTTVEDAVEAEDQHEKVSFLLTQHPQRKVMLVAEVALLRS